MDQTDLNQLLAVVGVVLAAVVLPPEAAVPVLTFLVGLMAGVALRRPNQ